MYIKNIIYKIFTYKSMCMLLKGFEFSEFHDKIDTKFILRSKGNMIIAKDIACTHAQKTQTHLGYRVYTKSVVEMERGRRCSGVVYTYLACKHSQGLPEEQQVPTDTTARVAGFTPRPYYRVHTRKVGGAPDI